MQVPILVVAKSYGNSPNRAICGSCLVKHKYEEISLQIWLEAQKCISSKARKLDTVRILHEFLDNNMNDDYWDA